MISVSGFSRNHDVWMKSHKTEISFEHDTRRRLGGQWKPIRNRHIFQNKNVFNCTCTCSLLSLWNLMFSEMMVKVKVNLNMMMMMTMIGMILSETQSENGVWVSPRRCHGHAAQILISISTPPLLTLMYIIFNMRKLIFIMMMMTREPVSWGNARGTATSPFWRTTTTTSTATTATTRSTGQCYNVAKGENWEYKRGQGSQTNWTKNKPNLMSNSRSHW